MARDKTPSITEIGTRLACEREIVDVVGVDEEIVG
jgi:hypothetical protein